MIIITGAAGFIGSYMLKYLNQQGHHNLLIVDDFSIDKKKKNWENLKYKHQIDREQLFDYLENEKPFVTAVIHLGARTDTTDENKAIFNKLNLNYSKKIWHYCTKNRTPLLYASSAATYGNGDLGFNDNKEISLYSPMNEYARSKQSFDQWALSQQEQPPHWYGFKFFNVYGPNEYHKGRMASVIFHAFHQINNTKEMKLFRSHRDDFKDGEQQRDFIYVKDVVNIIYQFLRTQKAPNGLYNLGTGQARTFNDLVKAVFSALNLEPQIKYIDTPLDIRDKYQYFTEANMQKTLNCLDNDYIFYSLEEGVKDYINQYLIDRL